MSRHRFRHAVVERKVVRHHHLEPLTKHEERLGELNEVKGKRLFIDTPAYMLNIGS